MPKTTEKIKVLFRLRSAEMGGVPKVVFDLLRNLPKEKFEFTLLLNLYQGVLRTEVPEHVRLVSIASGREEMSRNPLIRWIQLISRRIKLWYYEKFPKALYKDILKDEFDLEVSPGYAEFEWVLSSPNKKSRKIGWFHTDVGYDPDRNRVLKRIELMKKFDWMIFGSAQTRQVIEDLYGVTYPNSSVIYNVINIEEAVQKSERFEIKYEVHPVFSSLGRLHYRKGYDVLMRVHKRLLDEGYSHSIAIIGGGNEMGNLKNQAAELGVENTFLLFDTQTNPYPYIKASDFFILPSRSESYPLTIGEVMGLGMPIISTNVGGIPEMIEDGVDGMLIEFDEEEIYKAMKRFMDDPEWVKKLKEGASHAREKFDAERIYKEVTEVFERQFAMKK